MTRTPMVIALMVLAGATAGSPAGSASPHEAVTLSGTVRDAQTGAPLPNVRIHLQGTSHGTLTRANGEYRLSLPRQSLPGPAGRLTAQRIGYAEASVPVELAGSTIRTDFQMTPISLQLQSLVATGSAEIGYAPASSAAIQRSFAAADATYSRIANLPAPPPGWNRESYAHIDENDFLSVQENPLSTFSIDVDRASYST